MRFLRSLGAVQYFYLILFIYFAFGLVNLAYIPIPWLDEVACLDPAIQWHKTGVYASKAWAVKGADTIFLSYPPAIVWFHILNLYILPIQVFWVRLPFLILHCSAVFMLFHLLVKYIKLNTVWAFICALFFLFDKAVFEISRAMRSETLELFLLALLFLLFFKKVRPFFIGLIIGILLLTHLKEWPLAGTFAMWYCIFHCKKWQRAEFVFAISILPLIFLNFIHFNVSELYTQMFIYSGEHAAKGSILEKIYHFFVTRFFPVYKEQPWMVLVHLWICILSVKQVIKDYKKNFFAVLFLVTSAFWLVFLTHNYRYWIPLYFVGIFVIASWVKEKDPDIKVLKKWYAIPVYIMLLIPFISRHTLGVLQRNERNPEKALAFLEKHIKGDAKTLVFGDEISLYMTASHPNMDCGHELEPDNFNFRDYEIVYLITHAELPQLHLVSAYNPVHRELPKWLYLFGKGGTYYGMHIYSVKTAEEWNAVTKKYYK